MYIGTATGRTSAGPATCKTPAQVPGDAFKLMGRLRAHYSGRGDQRPPRMLQRIYALASTAKKKLKAT